MSASKVNHVLKGGNFRRLGYPVTGRLDVLEHLLKTEYLKKKIRVQGGAYGAYASFDWQGLAYFASYRDPHLAKTLETFDQVVEYVRSFKVSDKEMTRLIVGAFGKTDRPKTPSRKGWTAMTRFLRNITQADIQRQRDELLATTQEDIRKMAGMLSDILKGNTLCVYGNEKALEDNKQLFDKLVPVLK